MIEAQQLFLILTIFLTVQQEFVTTIIENMSCRSEIQDLYCHYESENSMQKLRVQLTPDTRRRYLIVDLVFDSSNLTVSTGFFQQVSELFDDNAFANDHSVTYEFRVKFQNFHYLNLSDRVFSTIFKNIDSRAEKHLTVNIYNSRSAPVNISSNIFSDLNLTMLTIHNADLTNLAFENLFDNSRIDAVNFKGTYVSTNPYKAFKGQINKVYLTKLASTLDSNEFPRFPVSEYIITALNIARIDPNSFAYHNNIYEMSIKGDNLSLKRGDLQHFQYLRKLVLDSVTIEDDAFVGVTRLEELDIRGANIQNLCSILQYAMHNPNVKISLPTSLPCTCELKYFLHLKGITDNPCYYSDLNCGNHHCDVVKEYSRNIIHSVTHEMKHDLKPSSDIQISSHKTEKVTTMEFEDQDEYSGNDGRRYSDEQSVMDFYHSQNESVHSGETELNEKKISDDSFSKHIILSTSDFESHDAYVDEHPLNESSAYNDNYESSVVRMQQITEREDEYVRPMPGEIQTIEPVPKSRLNWLPIVIVISVSFTLLLLALALYLMRRRKIKNREFKPIPSNEGLIGGGMGA